LYLNLIVLGLIKLPKKEKDEKPPLFGGLIAQEVKHAKKPPVRQSYP